MSLTFAVVRVLTQDDHLHISQRGEVQRGEHFRVRGKDGVADPLVGHKPL